MTVPRLVHLAMAALLAILLCHCVARRDASDEAGASSSADTSNQSFLVEEGQGSVAEATAYYASLGPNVVPGTYTLDQWVAETIGSRPTHKSLYRNSHELGFWREMTCTTYVGRGIGGCMVRNWNDPSDQAAGRPDLGTVTMSVSAEGFTRFYVFAPGGKLSPFAVLDDEGQKFIPRVCVVCHNGSYDVPSTGPDVRAIFREFEPSLLDVPPGSSSLEQSWFDLNQSVRSANFSLRSQAEGGPDGIDHAKTAQESYVRSIYSSTSPPESVSVRDSSHVPPSWAAVGDTPDLLAAKKALWTDLVAPYCMTCHRTNYEDWSEYKQFSPLASTVGGKSFLELYTAGVNHREGMSFMPQAKLLFDGLQKDDAAEGAITRWVAAVGGPACAAGTACVPSKACFAGAIDACDGATLKLSCKPTTPLADGTPCGADASCFHGECTPSKTITIPTIPSGVYVRNENPAAPEAHVHLAVDGQLRVTPVSEEGLCTQATSSELPCNVSNLTCTDSATGDSWKVIAGATLLRKNPAHPERDGTYRRESPIDLLPCAP